MNIVEDVRAVEAGFPGVVLTIGSFDGVHLGHRKVLDEVIHSARSMEGTAAVLTMRPHPREYFTPDRAPNLLTTDAKKAELLEEAGVDVLFFLPFNAETANLDRREFVQRILHERCRACTVVIGHDFRFGRNAKGDFDYLEAIGPDYGFLVKQVSPFYLEGERVGSTLIRERILQGDLDQAQRLLGRPYSIQGQVVHGRGLGQQLGFPTANIKPHHSAVPAQGVYAAKALVHGSAFPAAVNIGIAPTIRHEDITIEAHILDFHEDIFEEPIELVFHKRLRPERKFPSREALVAQITHDVESVRQLLQTD